MSKRAGLEAKLSALAAIRPALVVGVAMTLMVFVRGLFNLVFDHAPEIDWKFEFIVSASITIVWFLVWFLSTFFDLRRGDARDVQRNPSFGAASFEAGLYGTLVLMSLVMISHFRFSHGRAQYAAPPTR